MKTLTNCFKTLAVGALFASTALLSPLASALEGTENETIIANFGDYSQVEGFCSNHTCISVVYSAPNGNTNYRVTFYW